MKRVYDCIEKRYIEAENITALTRKVGLKDRSKFSRLLSGSNRCIEHRYLARKEDSFILIDIDSKEEFECADKVNFFYLIGEDYDEKTSKYIYEVLKGRQKGFSFKGKVYSLKNSLPTGKKKYISNSGFIDDAHKKLKQESLIAKRARKRVWDALRKQNIIKQKKTFDLIGCTPQFLLGWLEAQFIDGMSWENYGRDDFNNYKSWHIDHIKPCNTFNLLDESQLNECFHYTNLRPLWGYDNLSRPKNGSDMN